LWIESTYSEFKSIFDDSVFGHNLENAIIDEWGNDS
jgi:hypothetical protein